MKRNFIKTITVGLLAICLMAGCQKTNQTKESMAKEPAETTQNNQQAAGSDTAAIPADQGQIIEEGAKTKEELITPLSEDMAAVKSNPLFQKFETKDLDGEKVDQSIFGQNKLTLVSVWNSLCKDAAKDLQTLDQLAKDYQDKGLAVKGLVYNFKPELPGEEIDAVKGIIKEAGVDLQQFTASEEMHNNGLLDKISYVPTAFFVDSQGKILEIQEGPTTIEAWKLLVDEILADMK